MGSGMAVAKILIVEDEILIAQVIADQLKRLGYEIVGIVNSGGAALTLAAETHPDLVLMDIVLKKHGMDGITAASQIREQFQIPVIYLTAYSDDATLRRAKVTEPFGYIVKPFDQRDLRIAVELALHKHQLEQQLAERETLLSTILESTTNGVVATDAEGAIAYMNPVAETLTGWTLSEAKGQSIKDLMRLVDEVTETAVENPVMRVLRGGQEVQENRLMLVARDGSRTPISDRVSPILQEVDRIQGAVLVFWDLSERRRAEALVLEQLKLTTQVTEHRQAEAEVRRILAAEQELNELKSRLVTMISHEYRTPLAVILTSTELIKRYSDQLTEAKRDTYLDRIQGAVRQMAQLVDKVLTFSKAEEGTLSLNPVQLEVVDFCRQLVEEQQCLVGDRYTLNFEHPDVEVSAQLDEQILRHILVNLLTNAIKYSSKGSTVLLSLVPEHQHVVFQVQDEGMGIPTAEQPRLFSPLFRASNVGSIPGTGMGLCIVEKCVRLHEGQIAIDSEVGKGTTVTVTLPLR